MPKLARDRVDRIVYQEACDLVARAVERAGELLEFRGEPVEQAHELRRRQHRRLTLQLAAPLQRVEHVLGVGGQAGAGGGETAVLEGENPIGDVDDPAVVPRTPNYSPNFNRYYVPGYLRW